MRRRSATGSSVAVFSLSISIAPELSSTMRLIIRRSVVLPEPEEPTSTVVLREGMTRLKFSTATVPSGNLFVTSRNSIIDGSFLVVAHPNTWHPAKHYSQPVSFPDGSYPCEIHREPNRTAVE